MKNSPLILCLVAFLAGAALVGAIGQLKKGDESGLSDQLSEAQAEIDKLKAQMASRQAAPKLSSLPSAIPAKIESVATDDEDGEAEVAAADEGDGEDDNPDVEDNGGPTKNGPS